MHISRFLQTRIMSKVWLGILFFTSGLAEAEKLLLGVHSALEVPALGDLQDHVDIISDAGVDVARFQVRWWLMQPDENAPISLDDLDARIFALVEAGIKPLLVLAGAPPFVYGSSTSCLSDEGNVAPPDGLDEYCVPTDEADFTTYIEHWKNFAGLLANRYKDYGVLWELGNEPNTWSFWRPGPNPAQYARWASELTASIRASHPSAQIAFGSTVVLETDYRLATTCVATLNSPLDPPCQISGIQFLADVLDEGLILPEHVSLHPYYCGERNPAPSPGAAEVADENNFSDVAKVRQMLLDRGRGDLKIWLTEFGWSSDTSGNGCNGWVGPVNQAAYLQEAFEIIHSEWPYVSIAIWFWDIARGSSPHNSFSLFDSAGLAKPSGETFQHYRETHLPCLDVTNCEATPAQAPIIVALDAYGPLQNNLWAALSHLGPKVEIQLRDRMSSESVGVFSDPEIARTSVKGLDHVALILKTKQQIDLLKSGDLEISVVDKISMLASGFVTVLNNPLLVEEIGNGCSSKECIWIKGENIRPDASVVFFQAYPWQKIKASSAPEIKWTFDQENGKTIITTQLNSQLLALRDSNNLYVLVLNMGGLGGEWSAPCLAPVAGSSRTSCSVSASSPGWDDGTSSALPVL